MSAFREALKSGGHGEWRIEFTASGEVSLRKIEEPKSDVRSVTPAEVEDSIAMQTAA